MWDNIQLIVSIEFEESDDFSERVSSSLDCILKDLHSKWLLDDH
jgi:hypothetical protein